MAGHTGQATSRLAQKKGGDDTQVLKAIQAANGDAPSRMLMGLSKVVEPPLES
jgi:hypothetical protein